MNKNNVRVIGLFFILSVSLLLSTLALAEQFDLLTKIKDVSTMTVWRIDKPNVKQPADIAKFF